MSRIDVVPVDFRHACLSVQTASKPQITPAMISICSGARLEVHVTAEMKMFSIQRGEMLS